MQRFGDKLDLIETNRPADERKEDRAVFLPSANLHPDELRAHHANNNNNHNNFEQFQVPELPIEPTSAPLQPVHRQPTPTILSPSAGGVGIDLKRTVSANNNNNYGNHSNSNSSSKPYGLQRSATEKLGAKTPVSAASFYKNGGSPVLANRTVDKAALMAKMSPGNSKKPSSAAPSPLSRNASAGASSMPKSIRGGLSRAVSTSAAPQLDCSNSSSVH